MITHKLAKELKDAGFPQTGNGSWIGSPSKLVWRSGDRVYVPTLEELISACSQFKRLFVVRSDFWQAESDEPELFATGGSPSEAVAKLWLITR
jgi:hypothetical protein